jgi:glycyl-tRNA synthetase
LKHRNFIIPSFEIYNGTSGLYDLGPPACSVKNNILSYWRDFFVIEDDILEIETTILTPHNVLKTSGHVDRFNDLMIKDGNSGKYHRADHLLEEILDYILNDDSLTPELANEYKIIRAKADTYSCEDLDDLLKVKFKKKLQELHKDINVDDSSCKPINLMFQTNIDPSSNLLAYLRPETAQGIFVNFPKLLASNGDKMPVIAAQIGKSFRNEITPRNG